jgi:hypothetical protein
MAGVLVLLSNMAQASNKKTSTKSTRAPKNTLTTDPSIRGEKRWLLLALLVSILFVAFVGNRLIVRHRNMVEIKAIQASQEDKARFMKVEADMKEARAAIIAAVGQPAHEEEDKSCRHKSAKFKEGILVCWLSVHDSYVNIVDDQKILDSLSDYFTVDKGRPTLSLGTANKGYIKEYSLGSDEGLTCSIKLEAETGKGLIVDLNCDDTVQRPIYPLAE